MRVTKKELLNFTRLFVKNLTDALEIVNFNNVEIISIKKECDTVTEITKTCDKKILGTMNDLVFHYTYFLQDGSSLDEAIYHCNQIPHKNLATNAIEVLLDLTAR